MGQSEQRLEESGILGIKMETCRCIRLLREPQTSSSFCHPDKIAIPFLSEEVAPAWHNCPLLLSFFFHCSFWKLRLWLTNLPCQELTLSINILWKTLNSEDLKYDIGSVSACNEFGSCHSIITSKKLNKLKIQLFLEPLKKWGHKANCCSQN